MAMGKSTVGRNIDSRTRLLNSLGMFQAQQRRDEGKCCHGSLLPPRKDGRDGSNPRKDCRDVSPNTNHLGGDKKKIRHVRSFSDIPVRSVLHNTVAFETRLNDENITRNYKDKRSSAQRRSSLAGKNKADHNSSRNSTSPPSVRFNTVVSGVKIPSRNQYSSRIKQTLWRDRYELSEMVERNTTEFHSENYDWNQVVLDEEMYVDATSGERVHPCHVEDQSHEDDDDYDADLFVDGPGFAPLSRSDSITTCSKSWWWKPNGQIVVTWSCVFIRIRLFDFAVALLVETKYRIKSNDWIERLNLEGLANWNEPNRTLFAPSLVFGEFSLSYQTNKLELCTITCPWDKQELCRNHCSAALIPDGILISTPIVDIDTESTKHYQNMFWVFSHVIHY